MCEYWDPIVLGRIKSSADKSRRGKKDKRGGDTLKRVGMYGVTNANKPIALLEKNLTGAVFAHYAVITPETANIPGDVLEAVPVRGVHNSPTGDPLGSLWDHIVAQVTNLVIKASEFIKNGLIAMGILSAGGHCQYWTCSYVK